MEHEEKKSKPKVGGSMGQLQCCSVSAAITSVWCQYISSPCHELMETLFWICLQKSSKKGGKPGEQPPECKQQ